MSQAILTKLEEDGILPLFYSADLETAKSVVRASYEGGSRVFEFTNRGEKAYEVFEGLIAFVRQELPGLSLGIGTVYDVTTAEKFIEAGADFIVQPIFNAAVGASCNRAGIPWFPGVSTLTEIYNARIAGADVVKLFPGDVVGSKFIKAIKGPMSDVKVVVTGGVKPTRESLSEWFGAGAFAVGLGSNLFPSDLIEARQFDQISRQIKECLELVKAIRGH